MFLSLQLSFCSLNISQILQKKIDFFTQMFLSLHLSFFLLLRYFSTFLLWTNHWNILYSSIIYISSKIFGFFLHFCIYLNSITFSFYNNYCLVTLHTSENYKSDQRYENHLILKKTMVSTSVHLNACMMKIS